MEIQSNLQVADSQSLLLQRAQDFKNEIEEMDLSQLKITLKKLNYLSFEIDPYHLDLLKSETESILDEFELRVFLDNPFDFTNILLKMIDMTESSINNKYQ